MKAAKILPFLFFPFVVSDYTKAADPPQVKGEVSKLNLGQLIKLPELTAEDIKALNEIETFLENYTGGRFDYSVRRILIEGLLRDNNAINEEGERAGLILGLPARMYPNNIFTINYLMVQEQVRERAYAEITAGLERLGISPKTIKNPVNPIKYYVTKDELIKFKTNVEHVAKKAKGLLPSGTAVVFEDGITVETVRAIKNKKFPPGAKIVKALPQKEQKISTGKANRGLGVLEEIDKAAYDAVKMPLDILRVF